jgi:SpoVK/Ycf46/Vps4 family AAA+-type ATPase
VPDVTIPPGIEGIVRIRELPDDDWRERWDRIFVADGIKERLLNALLFDLRQRQKASGVGLAIHGLIVLSGPPGTGKTTLAAGLADQAARILDDGPVFFVDINPHAFPSQLLGESQRSVARLFERTLPDLARRGRPLVILIDEVESMAVNRTGASLETNPVDVHRSTDAVLAGLDRVARDWPNVVFLATTNFRSGVDPAFLSRADLIEEIGLPGWEAVSAILVDTLNELGASAAAGAPGLADVAAECVAAGLDARQIRKLVVGSAWNSRELALDPSLLTLEDVRVELARHAAAAPASNPASSNGTGASAAADATTDRPAGTGPRTR